jgi:hypothetical protein
VLILSRCGCEDVGDRVVNPPSGKLSRQPEAVPEATTEFINSVLEGTLYLHNQAALKVLGSPISLTHTVSKGQICSAREFLFRNS